MSYKVMGSCIYCTRCEEVCPTGAAYFNGESYDIDPEKCIDCGACAEACRMRIILPEDHIEPDAPQRGNALVDDCDLLVIGGGSSGIMCAAKFAEATGKKVIILEKLKTLGGGGQYARGLRMFGTKWERDAGVPEQLDDYVRSAMNTTRWELQPKLVYNSFKALGEMFDWMCTWTDMTQGFELSYRTPGMPPQEAGDHKEAPVRLPEGVFPSVETKDWGGKFIVEQLEQKLSQLNVTVYYEAAATQLIMDGSRVIGVAARDKAGDMIITCKSCLLATGNVGGGDALRRTVPEFYVCRDRPTAHRMPTCTGDHITMAEQAGIPVDYASVAAAYMGGIEQPFACSIGNQSNIPEALKINLEGKRWINEAWKDSTGPIWRQLKQPGGESWTILDADILNSQRLPAYNPPVDRTGRDVSVGVPDAQGNYKGCGDKFTMIRCFDGEKVDIEALREEASRLKGGHLFVEDTLDALAAKMGVDPAAFSETVTRYNELCQKGRDEDFFKPVMYMLPIVSPPYIAIHTHMSTDGVFGGIDVDENMQVLGKDGPVLGLYCTGDAVGNRYIAPGGEKLEIINDFPWACASGYLAAEKIAKDID